MFRGYYLNLDRSPERRARLTADLAARGIADRYERLAAIEGKQVASEYATTLSAGELGLWLTHERLLGAVGPTPTEHLHVLEDDAVLSRSFASSLDDALCHLDTAHPDWDVLFTEVLFQVKTHEFVFFANPLQDFAASGRRTVASLATIDFCGTSSLVLNRRRISRYADVIRGQWSRGQPLDLHLRDEVQAGRLNAFVTIPFITSISPDSAASEIRGTLDRSRQVVDTYRRAFFEDADLTMLGPEMERLTSGARVSLPTALYLRAEMFTMSDQWQKF